jgi:molecular chaperone GrpE
MPDIKNDEDHLSGSFGSGEESEHPENMEDEIDQFKETRNTIEAEKEVKGDLEQLQKQLGLAEAMVDSYKDQLLRLAAEFENFKKRVEVDKSEFVKFSNEKMIRDLIPILDDFERALANGEKISETESFRKGVELICQKLYKLLEDKGLKPIDSVGKEFDVMYHDVLMQVPRGDVKPDTIVEEIERGYTLHGKVIKHAKVIVASPAKDQTDSREKNQIR